MARYLIMECRTILDEYYGDAERFPLKVVDSYEEYIGKYDGDTWYEVYEILANGELRLIHSEEGWAHPERLKK